MIENDEMLVVYLNKQIHNIFKTLPLFELKNIGLESYVDSLLGGLYKLDKVIKIEHGFEYLSILTCLEFAKDEISKIDSRHFIIKRELFKSIDIVKTLIDKIENGE